MSTYETILVENAPEEKSAVVKLNRPKVLNAINLKMLEELEAVFNRLEQDGNVHSIILTGNHPYAFCGGADSHALINEYSMEERVKFISTMENLYWKMAELSKPIIGAINGYAIGGGSQLAAACDVRTGSYRTNFQFAGATYGLVVGAWQLAAIVGPNRAQELIITARFIKGTEAEKLGLIHHIFDGTELERKTLQLAKQISQNSLKGIKAAKRATRFAFGSTYEEAFLHEKEHNIQNIKSPEFVEGLQRSVDSRVKK